MSQSFKREFENLQKGDFENLQEGNHLIRGANVMAT